MKGLKAPNIFGQFLMRAYKSRKQAGNKKEIWNTSNLSYICDALSDLVPFAYLKKLEKHP